MNTIISLPESAWRVSRRGFFRRLGRTGAVAAAFPAAANALIRSPQAISSEPGKNETFWELVKQQFILREGLILMNAANLCPSPISVMETVFGYLRDEDEDASFQNRAKYEEFLEISRAKLAGLMGASADEIAMVRNTSEGNNLAVNALDLKAGDEVLLWDQNHPTNNVAWRVRAARQGFAVKYVTLPWPPTSVEEILNAFQKGFTPHTRVLSFSDVSNVSGTALPAKELCAMGHEHGTLVHIDGAQTFGVKKLNLHDVGCDSYAGSTHKWFVGPKEAGLFYVRKDRITDTWPLVVGSGWGDEVAPAPEGARKFETLGQRNDATLAAVAKACELHNILGEELVEKRTRELAAALKEGIAGIPSAKLYTSLDPVLSLGVVIFNLGPGVDHGRAYRELYEKYGVGAAHFPGAKPKLRLCPHIYNTMAEVEKVVSALHSLAGRSA